MKERNPLLTTTETPAKPTRTRRAYRKRATTAKKVTNHLILLLDESGSMTTVAGDVRGGVNGYLEPLKTDGNTYRVSIIKFGSTVRPLCHELPLEEVAPLTEKNYYPFDSTALYDALGYAFEDAKVWDEGDEPITIVIFTDGHENSSARYSKEQITAKIERRMRAGNWTFVYLDKNLDGWDTGASLGIPRGNIHIYKYERITPLWCNLAATTSASATSGVLSNTRYFNAGGDPSVSVTIPATSTGSANP